MPLDFKHTCPTINRHIERIEHSIRDTLLDKFQDMLPLVSGTYLKGMVDVWATEIYLNISDDIEAIRETNEDMRSAADKQIDDLVDELASLKQEMEC